MNRYTCFSQLMLYIVLCLCQIVLSKQLEGAEPLKPSRAEQPPVIDGLLNDDIWQNTLKVTEFTTFAPDFGKTISEKTEAYMAYDGENLYFAFRCYDREPHQIKSSVTFRDNIIPDDWICINLDSFNDQQALYAFYVNAKGIQADSRFSAGVEDFSSDLIWYSESQTDDQGYTVEIKIPLKSIRYANTNPAYMSIFFERYISRRSEHGSYPAFDPDKGFAFLTQMQALELHDLRDSRLIEILPSATYSRQSRREENRLKPYRNRPELSLNVKFGLTSDLILDGTYNPDFSQIEADAGQVDINLRSDLFFAEKRPFFLEGKENFQFAAESASETDPVRTIVHTRNIVNPLTGFKLTGKVTPKTTVAFLYALDELSASDSAGRYAHVPVIRFKQNLNDDSYIGAIYTGIEQDNGYNRVLGTDVFYRLTKSSQIQAHAVASWNKDEMASEQAGRALGFRYYYNTRNLDGDVTIKDVSKNLAIGTGYVRRTGIGSVTGLLRPKFYPKTEHIQRIDAEIYSAQTKDYESGEWETFNHVSVQPYFFGRSTVKLKYSYSTEIFLNKKFNTGGYHAMVDSWINNKLSAGLLYRHIQSVFYSADPYQGYSNILNASLYYQPIERIETELSYIYSDFYRKSDSKKLIDYKIGRGKISYQFNKYLFFRAVAEYNDYHKTLLTDFLLSFTYVPGTVFHAGYGSIYEKSEWNPAEQNYTYNRRFTEVRRGVFLKMSYLWRV